MAIRRSRLLPLLPLALAACNTVQDQFSRQVLTPPTSWLVEPAALGLDAEPFEIVLHREASLTGFFVPNPAADGRTVVLFHGGDTNASVLGNYLTFLHGAGFQVVAFDPRGFGRSKGVPTLQAWLYDLPHLFAWLRARPDVKQLALYGSGLGSLAALWAARTQGPCVALVAESLPSLRALLLPTDERDSPGTLFAAGWAEFAALPENIEPVDNAPATKVPALFVLGENEPERDRASLLATNAAYAGPHQFWVLHDTDAPPHAFLTYDGEYQQNLSTFLRSAFAGRPQLVAASAAKVRDASDGHAWYEFDLRCPDLAGERTAVEVSAALPDGSLHAANAWLENGSGRVRMRLPAAPVQVGAMVAPGATADAEYGWQRAMTPLSRAGEAVAALWPRIEELRHETIRPSDLGQLAQDLAAAEAQAPFPPQLESELADVFSRLGAALLKSDDAATAARGRTLLERAVAAVPAKPELHFWPGPTATYGWPQEDAVLRARQLLGGVQR
ncbi:MAG: alpha/beta fold hydrolase [Planctomycetes bacterium]|nr:alpha/beta fold hydrolase [Planctomycetota bacterium]